MVSFDTQSYLVLAHIVLLALRLVHSGFKQLRAMMSFVDTD